MKILFVSTYAKMGREISRLKEEFANDEIEVIDLQHMSREEAVDYIGASDCDIVISRGGTYRYIKDRVQCPVLPIDVTVYDIINILDFTNIEDTLIVGVREITEFADRLSELTRVPLTVLSMKNHDELAGLVDKIRGFGTVYSDYNSYVYLEKRGIPVRLIESSYQSVREAYIRAGNLFREIQELKRQEQILDAYLLDENKNVYLYRGRELVIRRITNSLFQEEIEGLVEEHLEAFLRGGVLEKCLYKNEYFIRVYNHHFRTEQERMTAVKVEFVKYPRALADMAFMAEGLANYHMVLEEQEDLLLYAASSLPVVISASDEILKRKGFSEIISHSRYAESTPFYIRFGTYTDSRLRKLFEDERSVLNLSHHVIIFDGLEALGGQYRELLKNFFLDSRILATNKIVLSVRRTELLSEIMGALPYHFLRLSSYFERKDKEDIIRSNLEEFEIPVEGETIEALKRRNFATEMDLKRALTNWGMQQEKELDGTEQRQKYLEQVTLEYALKVLGEENGNRTRAAERLGIGRTTLWRMLRTVERL